MHGYIQEYVISLSSYRKWMERFGISVRDEELKGVNDDGVDGYKVEVLNEDLAE